MTGYTVERIVQDGNGGEFTYHFEIEGVTPGVASTIADMLKFNAEHDRGLHKQHRRYQPEDFDRMRGLCDPKPSKKGKVVVA